MAGGQRFAFDDLAEGGVELGYAATRPAARLESATLRRP
jgi:hypothetical protein